MHIAYRLMFRILIGCLIHGEGSTDHISWDHNHFIWYLGNREKINLASYIFKHLHEAITESHKNGKKNVFYARLLSELFHQGILIETPKEDGSTQDSDKSFGSIISDVVLGNMKIIRKKDVVKPEAGLRIISAKSTYIKDFPMISKLENLKVIQEYINMARE